MIAISPYEVDDALSRHGGEMMIRKVGDVVYGDGFVCKVVALYTLDSDVLEGLSARLERICYYALGFVLNRVTNINLLALDFGISPLHALPKLSDAALHIFNYLM